MSDVKTCLADGTRWLPIRENPWNTEFDGAARAKLRFDGDAQCFHVTLNATERRIAMRAEAMEQNGRVWEDSCLEFFLNPMPEAGLGYMNFESNSRGVMLFGVHNGEMDGQTDVITIADCHMVATSRQLPGDLVNWTLRYRIPFDYIRHFFPGFDPKSGGRITGNFYKCGDKCIQPHYRTWSPIRPQPMTFHCPDQFGTILL